MRTDPDILDLSDEPSPPPRRGRGRPKKVIVSGTLDEALKEAQIRARNAAAAKVELETERRRGDLVPIEDVRQAWAQIALDLRAAVLAIPSRITGLDRAQLARLNAELRAALEGISHDNAE